MNVSMNVCFVGSPQLVIHIHPHLVVVVVVVSCPPSCLYLYRKYYYLVDHCNVFVKVYLMFCYVYVCTCVLSPDWLDGFCCVSIGISGTQMLQLRSAYWLVELLASDWLISHAAL